MSRSVLDTVPVEGLNRAQRKASRRAAYRLNTVAARTQHRADLVTMRAAEEAAVNNGTLKRQYPGRRGGRRVRLVWADTDAFTTWQDEYQALPRTADTRFTLSIGPAAYENPGDEVTPPGGRRFTEIQATEEEQDWFDAQGVTLANPGGFDPLSEGDEI